MSDRDCENCKHHTEKGCDSWDCEFEQGMKRKEIIEMLKVLKEQALKSHNDTAIIDVKKDSFIYVMNVTINSLEIDERYELEYEQIEPCDDAISREPFTNSTICEGFSCEECSFNRKDKGGCILEERVMKLPPVTPKTKTGHWREDIDNNRRWDRVRFYCSECGKWQTYGKTHYCPNCGAKMQEEEE